MTQLLRTHPVVKILIGVYLCVPPLPAAAQSAGPQIKITPGNCTSGVHLVARDARLSDVLRRLSESLAFQLRYEGSADSDSIVDINVSLPAPELVAKLSSIDSVIVSQSRDPRCPRQYRIDKVWVLPRTREGKLGPAVATQAPREQTSSLEQIRRFDEMARQAKEQYEAYERAHGKPPPGEEEEVAKRK